VTRRAPRLTRRRAREVPVDPPGRALSWHAHLWRHRLQPIAGEKLDYVPGHFETPQHVVAGAGPPSIADSATYRIARFLAVLCCRLSM
jgi:hypothetical protein